MIRLRVIVVVAVSIVALAPAAGSQSLSEGQLAFSYPAWSHDGTRIALIGQVDPYHRQYLFEMNSDGSGLRKIETGQDVVFSPSWSPRDKRIAFAALGGGIDPVTGVWVIGSGGRGLRLVVGNGGTPAWSPGGRLIAFTAERTDCTCGEVIHVVRPDRSDDTVAAAPDSRLSYSGPTWSPDGERLAFSVFGAPDVAGPAGFGVISDFGAEPKVFLPGEAVVSLAWSPSGREIAFTENDGRSDSVWLIDLRTRRTRRLHDGYFPSWSPDGKRLVFVRGTLPGGSIWVMNRDGSHLRLLLRGSSD